MKNELLDSPCRNCDHDKFSVCHTYKCTKYKLWLTVKWRKVTNDLKGVKANER